MARSSASWGGELDLPQITRVVSPHSRETLPPWREDAAWLAGGTWLFSEPQPALRSLVDLSAMGWPDLEPSAAGLRIAATCTIAALEAFRAPHDWPAAGLFGQCANALLGSFKIWNMATVGGNVCLSLPAAPMLALSVALDGVAWLWQPDGGERFLPMADFTVGPQQNSLRPGELLRAIDFPAASLRRRSAMRQASLTNLGRSAALLVSTLDDRGKFAMTITASTVRPVQLTWNSPPSVDALDACIEALPAEIWLDDVHGTPAWRRHMTRRLAAELQGELLA